MPYCVISTLSKRIMRRLLAVLGFGLWLAGNSAIAQIGNCWVQGGNSDYGFNYILLNGQNITWNQNVMVNPGTQNTIEVGWYNNTQNVAYLLFNMDADGVGNGIAPNMALVDDFSSNPTNVTTFTFNAPASTGNNYPMTIWGFIDDNLPDSLAYKCIGFTGELDPVGIMKTIQKPPIPNPKAQLASIHQGNPTIVPPMNSSCFVFEEQAEKYEGTISIPINPLVLTTNSANLHLNIELFEVLSDPVTGNLEFIGVSLIGNNGPTPNHHETPITIYQGTQASVLYDFEVGSFGMPSNPLSGLYTGDAVKFGNGTIRAEFWLEDANGSQIALYNSLIQNSLLPNSVGAINIYNCNQSENARIANGINSEFSFSIEPNPASNKIYISFLGVVESDLEIRIYNNQGQLVLSENGRILDRLKGAIINLIGYESGIYTVMAFSEGRRCVKRIILN